MWLDIGIYSVDVGFVDMYVVLEKRGCKVDRDVLKFGVVVLVFVEEKGEFLVVFEGGDGYEVLVIFLDNVGD